MSEPTVGIRILAQAEQARAQLSQLNASLTSVATTARTVSQSATSSISRLDTGLAAATTTARSMGQALAVALGGAAGLYATKNVLNLAVEMDRLRSTMSVVAGSTAQVNGELAYAAQVADRLKINTLAATDAYAKLAVAAKGTALEGAGAREVFEGLSTAGVALGLSTDRLGLAFQAVQQIIDKQKVSAEELRGQLGEQLAGTFQAAARATGLSVQEFNEALEGGLLNANSFVLALARELKTTYEPAVRASLGGARAAVADFENAWIDLKLAFADSGFIAGVTDAMQELSATFRDPQFRAAVTEVSEKLGAMIRYVVENRETIAAAMGALYGASKGGAIGRMFGPKGAVIGAAGGALLGGSAAYALMPDGEGAGSATVETRVKNLRRQIEEIESSIALADARQRARLQATLKERKEALEGLLSQQKKLAEPKAALDLGPVLDPGEAQKEDPLAQFIEETTDARAAAFSRLWRMTQERVDLTARQQQEIYGQLQERFMPRRQVDPAVQAQLEADFRYIEDLASGKAQQEQFDAAQARLQSIRSRLDAEVTVGAKSQAAAQAELREETARLGQELGAALLPRLRELIATFPQSENLEAWREMVAQIEAMQRAGERPTWIAGARAALEEYSNTAGDVFAQTQQIVASAFQGMEDALMRFVETGKLSFTDLVNSILQDLARLMIRRAIIAPLADALGSFLPSFGSMGGGGGDTTLGGYTGGDLLGSAKGNVFNSPSLHQYVNQIHDTPKFFTFAKGGVFAEAGPEAVMPLTRDASGRLGVHASGGGGAVSVQVHNYSGQPAQTRESTDSRGNRSVEVMIGEMVAGEMARPGSAVYQATRGAFGLRPNMVMR